MQMVDVFEQQGELSVAEETQGRAAPNDPLRSRPRLRRGGPRQQALNHAEQVGVPAIKFHLHGRAGRQGDRQGGGRRSGRSLRGGGRGSGKAKQERQNGGSSHGGFLWSNSLDVWPDVRLPRLDFLPEH